jgi:hypothetical protein
MFLGPALQLCPTLQTIPYDFPGYESVSRILYDTVASYTLDIQASLHQRAVWGICMFLGLPDPDPLVSDLDPDPSLFSYMC